MNYEESKKYLSDIYSKEGFEKVVINNSSSWMLKNESINNAYINLTLKDEILKLELFNVNVQFELEDLNGISIIQNIDGETKVLNIGNDLELMNKKASPEIEELRSKIKKNFFITTETSIDLSIEKRITVVSAQRIYGIHILKDIFTLIRDFVGGRVNSLEKALGNAHDDIIVDLEEKAYQHGGDAIIGLKVEHTYNNANNGSILSVFASGTVVKLKPENQTNNL